MGQQFIHIRVDPKLKDGAEKVLTSLGLTMTTGIHLFLSSVIQNRGIPFDIKQGRHSILGDKAAELERGFQRAVGEVIDRSLKDGYPVALYDKAKESSYLEYPDGMRVYADE